MAKSKSTSAKTKAVVVDTADKTTASNPAVAEKVVIKNEMATAGEIPQVGANEVLTAEKDLAVIGASGVKVGELGEAPEFKPTAENKEIIKKDKEAKANVADESVSISGSTAAYDAAILQKPMVKDPVSGRPVYESSDQERLALAANGDLATEAPAKKK